MNIVQGHAKMGNKFIAYAVCIEGEQWALTRTDHRETRVIMTGTLDECETEFLKRID